MSERFENLGHRESLRQQRRRLAAEASSLRESVRAALPVVADPEQIDGDYVLDLALRLREVLAELEGLDRKIGILNRELDG